MKRVLLATAAAHTVLGVAAPLLAAGNSGGLPFNDANTAPHGFFDGYNRFRRMLSI
jgi:hypothetical protein